jgi:hypothetical protein
MNERENWPLRCSVCSTPLISGISACAWVPDFVQCLACYDEREAITRSLGHERGIRRGFRGISGTPRAWLADPGCVSRAHRMKTEDFPL